jgi:hypothetical protein
MNPKKKKQQEKQEKTAEIKKRILGESLKSFYGKQDISDHQIGIVAHHL